MRLRLAPKGKDFLIVGKPTGDLLQAEQEARDISNLHLSRAFILAGTPSIVMSLWSVPDAETSQLMVNTYFGKPSRSDLVLVTHTP
ncbi:CHAT domain-containing protein [Pseudanabaena sp. UWO310]|uniref:CHAT domain-containing protein n=1 Tax=Pseudanabaena sp. UWO310 TaxID=2480795 RepID=UPI00115BE013|nr:CHAT domain-containing protein [Pseudanabaena sp. UWO310]TYQ31933.1 CHAT domain-containing protein [Pseudanabaena sp. UWO310]